MALALKIGDFTRGLQVTFEWSDGGAGDFAREKGIRPLGRVVTREDLPHMAGAVGVQLIDDTSWVIDPAFAMAKGKTFSVAS